MRNGSKERQYRWLKQSFPVGHNGVNAYNFLAPYSLVYSSPWSSSTEPWFKTPRSNPRTSSETVWKEAFMIQQRGWDLGQFWVTWLSPFDPPPFHHCILHEYLQQNVDVLQFWGLPPTWEHWREYSETVLQRQKESSESWQAHLSCMQARTYGSRSRRDAQSTKAEEVSSFSHSSL